MFLNFFHETTDFLFVVFLVWFSREVYIFLKQFYGLRSRDCIWNIFQAMLAYSIKFLIKAFSSLEKLINRWPYEKELIECAPDKWGVKNMRPRVFSLWIGFAVSRAADREMPLQRWPFFATNQLLCVPSLSSAVTGNHIELPRTTNNIVPPTRQRFWRPVSLYAVEVAQYVGNTNFFSTSHYLYFRLYYCFSQ